MLSWSSWSATDVGTVRTSNQDNFVDRADARLWAVADGAGGHQHGERASEALRETLEAVTDLGGADLVAAIRTRVAAVHESLCREAATQAQATGHPVTIASTLVVLLAQGGHFACLWCGDSRAYLLRGPAFTQISRDHSLVQEMVDAGAIAAEDAEQHPHANVLTRAIGAEGAEPVLDKIVGQAQPGDRFLLCSDGLSKALDATTIAGLLAGPDPANRLIAAALRAAARDNITAVVIETAAAAAAVAADDSGSDTMMTRPV